MESQEIRDLIAKTSAHTDLEQIRNNAHWNSELYQRAKDKILDIQLNTNNIQSGAFADFTKRYESQNARISQLIIILTVITVIIGVLGLVFQVIGLISSSSGSGVQIIQIEANK